MGYTDDPSMVRVDFFRPSGKWYTTESIKWIEWSHQKDGDIYKIFKQSLDEQLKGRLSEMVAVCLEPYHELSFPLMIFPKDINNEP